MLRAFLITVCAILGIVAAFLATRVDLTALSPGSNAPVAILIGSTKVKIPKPYLRNGDASQIVGEAFLVVGWPSFAPIKSSTATGHEPIFLSLVPPAAEPIDRSFALYARFLEGDSWSNPGGLMMRRFRSGSPYQDEELYFTPPEGETFAARCPKQGSPTDVGQQTCLWLFRANGLDIQARFSSALLPQWTRLNDGIRGLLGQWVAAGSKN